MVHAFIDGLDIYVCLVVLDDSQPSRAIAEILQRNYLRLHTITGQSLLLLSTIPPPPGWFATSDLFRRLPADAREYHAQELNRLGTPTGQAAARLNSHRLVREVFGELEPPALCYLQPKPSVDDPTSSYLDAIGFDISGLTDEAALVSAFEYLSGVAQRQHTLGAAPFEVGRKAHSLRSPRSLSWRNAAWKALHTADFVTEWIRKTKL